MNILQMKYSQLTSVLLKDCEHKSKSFLHAAASIIVPFFFNAKFLSLFLKLKEFSLKLFICWFRLENISKIQCDVCCNRKQKSSTRISCEHCHIDRRRRREHTHTKMKINLSQIFGRNDKRTNSGEQINEMYSLKSVNINCTMEEY